jgi:predicted unusual protein kinase regulating ubiquinone biosynthesis (AarF/ABC1/UbiB family)
MSTKRKSPDAFATTSGVGRAVRLASLSAGITGSYVGYMLQRAFLGEAGRASRRSETHAKVGRRIRDELLDMRGPIMKLGQALSMHTDMVPSELLAEISQLQMEAPGMHPSLAAAQFKASTGRTPESVFRSFDPEPFAAASLGQVHRAVLKDGTEVAVKIQYPGMRAAIENDFRLLRNAALPARATGHFTKDAIDEMESQITAETDYVREADNLEFFRSSLKPLPYVHVPRVFRDWSTDRVLVMSMMPGQHLEKLLAARPSQRLRDTIGERLFELFYFQVLSLHTLHADPHAGNYLFHSDGSIGLIDFGCVKRMGTAVVSGLRKSFLYQGAYDSPEFQKIIQEQFGRSGKPLPPKTRRAVVAFSERFYRKVYPPDARDDVQRFDFADPVFLPEYFKAANDLAYAKGTQPQYIFLARAEIGLYAALHRLRARVPTTAIVRRLLKESSG